MVPHSFRGKLGQHWVGRSWKEADFRVSFAKNKTHTWAWYTLTIKNVYGALPLQDKLKEYHTEREIYYPTIDFLVEFPVHYGLIDAYWSADGPFGIFADKEPNLTQTIIGGENLLAVDWVGASKMGLDPLVSRYMNLSHYQPLNPDMDDGNGQKRVEVDRATLPAHDQAAVFFLEPSEGALGLEARHLHLQRPAARLSALPDPFRQLRTDAASAELLA
jgi:uncharacterized protein (DUF362 family)